MTDNILNIDDLVSNATKTVVLDGVRHSMVETSVQGYINRVKRTRELPKDAGVEVQIEETIVLLHELFPTIAVDRMKRMSLFALDKLLAFAMEAPEDIAKRVESAVEKEEAESASAEGKAEPAAP